MLNKETQTTKTQTDNFNLALAGLGDPTAGETQEAELENEAEQENEAEINQVACRTGCLRV